MSSPRRRGAGHPIVELTRMRFREFVREPEALFWVFAFPLLMTLALGVAFRVQTPQPIPIGVVSGGGVSPGEGPRGGDAVEALSASPDVAVVVLSEAEADIALRNGRVDLVVTPGADGAPPAYRFDPSRPESRAARLAADDALQRAGGRRDVWDATRRETSAPGSRYVDWVVPGLLGMNIMSTSLWGIGFSIVQARMKKLLKRLTATPMRRSHYLLSHVLSRLLFLGLEAGVLVGFATLVFGVPMRGSWLVLAVVCLGGALSFGGLGLLVACRARTIEAVSGILNIVMLPMWIVSGVFFSSERFPAVMQPFIQALPLTALNQALRGVMMDGASWTTLGMQAGVLGAWGALSYVVALRIFRWQ